MIPVIVSKTLAAASANNIAASQTLGAAGNLTLNGSAASGGIATLDTQRRVLITSAGNDSGITYTVYGTREGGIPIQQTLIGANAGTVATDLDFLTVTQVAASGATGSTVTVGTNSTGSTAWKNPSWHMGPFNIQFELIVTGSVTYSVEYTLDDYYTPVSPGGATTLPNVRPTTVVAATTTQSLNNCPTVMRGWRVTVTAGTGTVRCEAVQSGIVNY